MSLNDTGLALGTVSRFLAAQLNAALSTLPPYNTVATIDRPQVLHSAGGALATGRLNLFLYEVEIDAAMRNISVPGAPAPLWLVLRYLLTAFDLAGESDTADSHDVLGLGMQVLSALDNRLFADPVNSSNALENNPEPIKLSFDQATPDLLSRLMQGPDDKYRCSTAFQIRPILVAKPAAPTSGLQLVGIDYTTGATIGLAGVQSAVLPSLGPRIDDALPSLVEQGDTLTLTGAGLNAPGLEVRFGQALLAVTMQQSTQLQARVQLLDPTQTSAGNIAVSVSQTLSTGVQLSSTVQSVGLLPTIAGMTLGTLSAVSATNNNVFGTISLTGVLLGTDHDYVEFALVRDGKSAVLLDAHDPTFTLPADQSAQRFAIPREQAVPPGVYFAVLRVNGMQARQAFVLNMVAP
jgi:hypothetical protein